MNIELDLRHIFFILWKRVWVLIVIMLLLGAAAFSASKWLIPKKYSATVSMFVYNQENRTSSITSGDLLTSQKLVSTYIVILKSNSVLEKVSDELGGDYSSEDIRKMLTTGAINDTEAFNISITNENPEAAQRIVNTIAKIVPAEIKRVVKAGAVEVIDYAELPDKATFPNPELNTVAAMLLGLLLSGAGLVIIEITDKAVRSEEDLAEAFEIPVLGVIPRLYGENGGLKDVQKR
jgi:capsular polysaccharide biosynthesis protein